MRPTTLGDFGHMFMTSRTRRNRRCLRRSCKGSPMSLGVVKDKTKAYVERSSIRTRRRRWRRWRGPGTGKRLGHSPAGGDRRGEAPRRGHQPLQRKFPGKHPGGGVPVPRRPRLDFADGGERMPWRPLLPRHKADSSREHVFELGKGEIENLGPISHVKLSMMPDGGVMRLRAFGQRTPSSRL